MTGTQAYLIATAFALSLASAPAMAEDHQLGKYTSGQIKEICDRNGGTFREAADGSLYGCHKACTGGTCAVICQPNEPCLGVTPRNQPTATGESAVAGALNATLMREEDDGDDHGRGKDGLPWGLFGLLGLIGLAGLRRDRGPVMGGVNR